MHTRRVLNDRRNEIRLKLPECFQLHLSKAQNNKTEREKKKKCSPRARTQTVSE